MSGYIYILSHELMPNLLKIGYTTRTVEKRVNELSSTGVPGKFTIELSFKNDNPELFEKLLHKSLGEYRYQKEFFKVDIKIAIEVIHILIKDNSLILYEFKGKSARIATTKEQIQEQNKIEEEKAQRVRDRANRIKAEYLEIPSYKLLDMYNKKELGNGVNHKEFFKIYELKLKQENEDYRKKQDEHRSFFDLYLKQDFINLFNQTNQLLINKSKNKIFLNLRGYTVNDGENLVKKLTQSEKALINDFCKILGQIAYPNIIDYVFKCLGLSEKTHNGLLFRTQPNKVTQYFQGVAKGLSLKIPYDLEEKHFY